MNLVFDAGNTNLKMGIFDTNDLIYFEHLNNFSSSYFQEVVLKYKSIKSVCVSNNANFLSELPRLCREFDIKYLNISHLTNLPITIDYLSPQSLGNDRIALASGSTKIKGDKLIIDFGTCITYDVVLDNNFIGGQISPGFYVRLSSLNHYTSKLPKINLEDVDNIIGKNTNECMLIGVIDSVLFEVEKVIEKYKKRFPNIQVIVTGGNLSFIKNRIKNINFIRPYLLMEGLNYIIAFNEKV
tara:strand:+ start:304 stop:1026 length:723 start_codon:yes stop_codon:yes gene_type:complete